GVDPRIGGPRAALLRDPGAPRPAADEDRSQARRLGGQDVVVQAVADVRDLRRRGGAFSRYALEELRSGLLDAPARRGADPVDRQAEAAEDIVGPRRLVARHTHLVPEPLQIR